MSFTGKVTLGVGVLAGLTSPGSGGGGGEPQLQLLPQLSRMLHEKPQQSQRCHDDHVVIALLAAALVAQQQLRVVLINWHLRREPGTNTQRQKLVV